MLFLLRAKFAALVCYVSFIIEEFCASSKTESDLREIGSSVKGLGIVLGVYSAGSFVRYSSVTWCFKSGGLRFKAESK